MDHFAKPDDELTRAQKEHSLYRNFQGYTTKAEADLVGMGVTAISMVGDVYSQNLKSLPDYQKAVMDGDLPVHRGYRLSLDDEMRRLVITRIMCDLEINRQNVLDPFGKNFDQVFSKEIGELDRFQQDGLLIITPEKITLTTTGRIFMRNIAMTFDRYLNVSAKGPLFSRTL
jgi:oxygen-independent coproporphyrinogen-3 oxidase